MYGGNKVSSRYYVSIEACLKEVEPELCLAWSESKKKKKKRMSIHPKRGIGSGRKQALG